MSYHQFGHVDRDERIDHVDEPESYPEGYDAPPPRRNVARMMLAAAVMTIFAGALWFAYHEGTRHTMTAGAPDTVPLIRASEEPVKVKPEHAGGMSVPDKDNPLYARTPAGSPPVERLLPPPEQPAPRPTAPPAQAPAPAPAAAAQPPAAEPQPAPPHQSAPPIKAPPVKASPAKAPPKAAPAANGPRIQLASVRTPEAAREEWARLKHANADLLGKLTANAVRADLGEKGIYYRVEAGPLPDRGAAIRMCKALRERGLGCTLVR